MKTTKLEKWEIDKAHAQARALIESIDVFLSDFRLDESAASIELIRAMYSFGRNIPAYYRCIAAKLDELRGL